MSLQKFNSKKHNFSTLFPVLAIIILSFYTAAPRQFANSSPTPVFAGFGMRQSESGKRGWRYLSLPIALTLCCKEDFL
jgi:hypothetical protein